MTYNKVVRGKRGNLQLRLPLVPILLYNIQYKMHIKMDRVFLKNDVDTEVHFMVWPAVADKPNLQ